MRRYPNLDANHNEAVKLLRQAGVSVQSLASVGKGCPDLLCGWHGINVLIEMKDGNKNKARRALTEDEAEWHAGWSGHVAIAESAAEALQIMEKAVKGGNR